MDRIPEDTATFLDALQERYPIMGYEPGKNMEEYLWYAAKADLIRTLCALYRIQREEDASAQRLFRSPNE